MKVKHILIVVLIIGITAYSVIYGLSPGDSVEGPKPLHIFDGGSNNRLKEPAYVITDNSRRIIVADSGNRRIAILNDKGRFVTEIGGIKSEKPLSYPYGLGILGRDRLLVADIVAGALLEYSLKGKFIKTWYSGSNFKPAGIFVTSDRKVYVSDLFGKQILVFSDQGKILETIKSRDVALNAPQGIWVNGDGTVWVADSGNYNVKLLHKNGKLVNLFDGGPQWPLSMAKGLSLDKKQRIYVSDTLSNVIRIFDNSGSNLGVIGQDSEGAGDFRFPVGLYIDEDDKLYIADQGNNQIQVWNLE